MRSGLNVVESLADSHHLNVVPTRSLGYEWVRTLQMASVVATVVDRSSVSSSTSSAISPRIVGETATNLSV